MKLKNSLSKIALITPLLFMSNLTDVTETKGVQASAQTNEYVQEQQYVSTMVTKTFPTKYASELATVQKVKREGIEATTVAKQKTVMTQNEIRTEDNKLLATIENGEILLPNSDKKGTWVTTFDGYGIIIDNELVYANTKILPQKELTLTTSFDEEGYIVRQIDSIESAIYVNQDNVPLYDMVISQQTGYIVDNYLFANNGMLLGNVENSIIFSEGNEIGEILSNKTTTIVANKVGIPLLVLKEGVEITPTKVIQIGNDIHFGTGEYIGTIQQADFVDKDENKIGNVVTENGKVLIKNEIQTLEVVNPPILYLTSDKKLMENGKVVAELLSDSQFLYNNQFYYVSPVGAQQYALIDGVPIFEIIKHTNLFPLSLTLDTIGIYEDNAHVQMNSNQFTLYVDIFENYGKITKLKIYVGNNLVNEQNVSIGIQKIPLHIKRDTNPTQALKVVAFADDKEVARQTVYLDFPNIAQLPDDIQNKLTQPETSDETTPTHNTMLPQTNTVPITSLPPLYVFFLGSVLTLLGGVLFTSKKQEQEQKYEYE